MTSNPTKRLGKRLYRHLAKEDKYLIDNHLKRCSTSILQENTY